MPLAIPAAAFDLLGFGARLPDTDPEVTFSSCHLSASFPFEEPVESDEECAPPSGFPAIDVLMAFSGKTDVSSSESHIDVIIVAHSGRRPIFASCQTVRYDINSENGRLENPIIIGGNTLVYKSVPTLSNIWSGSCRWALINDFPTTRPYSLIEGFATYLSGLPFPDANDCFNGTSDPCENRDPGLYALATVAATNDLIGDFSWTIETKVDLPFKISCEAIPANVLDLAEWSLNTFVDSLVDDVSSFLAGKAEDIVFRLFKRVFTFATGGLSNAVLKLTAEVLVDGVVTEVEDALSIDVSLLCCPGDEPELPDADGREYPPPQEYTVTLPRTASPANVIPDTVVWYLSGGNCASFRRGLKIYGSSPGARKAFPSTIGQRTFKVSSPDNSVRYERWFNKDSEGNTFEDYFVPYVTIGGVERRYSSWLRSNGDRLPSSWISRTGWSYGDANSQWLVQFDVGTRNVTVHAGCSGFRTSYGPRTTIYRTQGPDMIVRDNNGRLIKVENPPEGNPPPDFGSPELPEGPPEANPSGTRYRVSVGISVDLLPFIRKRPVLTDSNRRPGIPGANQTPFGNAVDAISGVTGLFDLDVGSIPLFEVCSDLPGSDLIADLVTEFSGYIIPGIGPVSPDIRIEAIGPCYPS